MSGEDFGSVATWKEVKDSTLQETFKQFFLAHVFLSYLIMC